MFYAHNHLNVALTRRANGWSLETFLEATLFRKSGSVV